MTCAIEKCNGKVHGFGWCNKHYRRWKRTGDPELLVKASHGYCSKDSDRYIEFKTWLAIKERCYNPKNPRYKKYGQRGIVVCGGWLKEFLNFYGDMGSRPEGRYSIDRIDNNGHYSCGHCQECLENRWPMNCQWITLNKQNRNTSRNRFLTYRGKTQTVIDWAEEVGLPSNTLYRRLQRGWDVEKVIETPHQGVGFRKGWNKSRL